MQHGDVSVSTMPIQESIVADLHSLGVPERRLDSNDAPISSVSRYQSAMESKSDLLGLLPLDSP
jgi:hypothetical protein